MHQGLAQPQALLAACRCEDRLEHSVHCCAQCESRREPRSPSGGHRESWQQGSEFTPFSCIPIPSGPTNETSTSGEADSPENIAQFAHLLKHRQWLPDIAYPT